MVFGQNKGHKYEAVIASKLLEHKVKVKQVCPECKGIEKFSSVKEKCPSCKKDLKLTSGSGAGEDAIFIHKGKQYSLELKNNLRDPDYGQCIVKPELINNEWKWDWSKSAKKKKELIGFYNNHKCVDGTVGVLEYINKKKIVPNKDRVSNEKLTREMKSQDQNAFEDRNNRVSVEAFEKFHRWKSDYVQIGGHGLYHINKDFAKLGTKKFDAKFILRLRAKSYYNHYPICTKCETRYKPSKKKCKSCNVSLTTSNKKSCRDCEKDDVPFEKFEHVWFDYGFIVLMKCNEIANKSNLDMEEKGDRLFPPIEA